MCGGNAGGSMAAYQVPNQAMVIHPASIVLFIRVVGSARARNDATEFKTARFD
jgi:hypothetical protein